MAAAHQAGGLDEFALKEAHQVPRIRTDDIGTPVSAPFTGTKPSAAEANVRWRRRQCLLADFLLLPAQRRPATYEASCSFPIGAPARVVPSDDKYEGPSVVNVQSLDHAVDVIQRPLIREKSSPSLLGSQTGPPPRYVLGAREILQICQLHGESAAAMQVQQQDQPNGLGKSDDVIVKNYSGRLLLRTPAAEMPGGAMAEVAKVGDHLNKGMSGVFFM